MGRGGVRQKTVRLVNVHFTLLPSPILFAASGYGSRPCLSISRDHSSTNQGVGENYITTNFDCLG